MRTYLKTEKTVEAFKKFANDNGADYIEKEDGYCYAVWKMPKKVDQFRAAIKLDISGDFMFGSINESCDNFVEPDGDCFVIEEIDWVLKVLSLIKKYKN